MYNNPPDSSNKATQTHQDRRPKYQKEAHKTTQHIMNSQHTSPLQNPTPNPKPCKFNELVCFSSGDQRFTTYAGWAEKTCELAGSPGLVQRFGLAVLGVNLRAVKAYYVSNQATSGRPVDLHGSGAFQKSGRLGSSTPELGTIQGEADDCLPLRSRRQTACPQPEVRSRRRRRACRNGQEKHSRSLSMRSSACFTSRVWSTTNDTWWHPASSVNCKDRLRDW